MDQYLAQIERILNTGVLESMGVGNYSGTLGVYKPIRELLFFAIADLMYYVSSDGKQDYENMCSATSPVRFRNLRIKPTALTYILYSFRWHIIMHDLLYNLYGKKKKTGEAVESEVKRILKYARRKSQEDTSATLLRVRRLLHIWLPDFTPFHPFQLTDQQITKPPIARH